MHHDHNAPPFNPLPWVVWLLVLPIVAMEVVFGLGASGIAGGPAAIGWRNEAVQWFGFNSSFLQWMIENGTFPPALLLRFVTYPFVHGSVTHAVFVAVFLLALGKFVGEVFRPLAVLAIFFCSAIVGALAFGLLAGPSQWLFGGYPADYGLIGAFTFLLWTRLGETGQNQYGAFSLIGFLMGIQLIFGVFFGSRPDWIADLAGFFTGFALSFLVGPGGWQRALAHLRQR
ncbi:rhomboid family intramembrane serine protease [Acidimangrovimonas pyrenivorans]|uniref:Rhomboid family intramembrane serine protease n=1 Tax=Acidimangrovimonas pyrenivorans TaxID=2030798 RepID=A0ABV7AKL7_9RHOB